ncbi:ATP-binding protein [Endothiovibrio diazotrophicus]
MKDQEHILRDQTDDLLQSVTEIQTRYDEVQALNVSLEQKVEARTAELTVANERLTELDKLKDRFLASISHELRTPLVALSSTLQMILNGDGDPALHRSLLENGSEALDDMLENVNDLLLKSRSERGMIDLRWSELEVGEFTRRALNVFGPLAMRKGLVLHFDNRLDGPLPLYADRPKLKKILNNLVGNALKYTDHGTVTVTLERTDRRCLLSVADSGRGIPEGELESIFQPFFQASNNPHREVQGAGIGLSLVRDLVQLHHGGITVESRLGEGSRFTVELPLGHDHVDWERLDDSPLTEEPDRRVDLRLRGFDDLDLAPFSERRADRQTVLLVEDNPQIVQVLGYLLRSHYDLHFARDGEEGLERIRAARPDLVISDIMMPRMNGYELLAAVRDDRALKGTPFILLTSKADRISRLRGFEEGADEYLTKPFNNDEVLIRVRGLLQRKRLEIEFAHLEKMVALGQLAAGIGHEINNPIAFATSAAETVEKAFGAVEAGRIGLDEGMKMMRGALERIKEGTRRVAEITEALRGFVRQGAKGFQPYDIHPAIEATLTILNTTHKAEVRFTRRFELAEKVECNINQLNQVILNLVKNATQALEGVEGAEIIIATAREGEEARIVVEDNGPGIPAELLGRIFDPFFTTRALGSGTGLGLHICRQIVDEHQGRLTAGNHRGGGARFTIHLPLRQKGSADHDGGFTHPHADRRLEAIRYPHRR